MQIIPIDKDEQDLIDKNLEPYRLTSATAKRMLIASSPVCSPTRRDSVSNDSYTVRNFIKQSIVPQLEDIIKDAEEKERKYEVLLDKIHQFGT